MIRSEQQLSWLAADRDVSVCSVSISQAEVWYRVMKQVPECSLSSADPDRKWGGGVRGDRVSTCAVGGTKVSCKVAFILTKIILTNNFNLLV